ncbi:hypothetical protein [Streptomyces sp. NPDC102370]|uniref:hypothetical protein n=1 Tax=Streptomyces sp. NPDC102370 TaxID=3366163 RepID=UPI00382B50F2
MTVRAAWLLPGGSGPGQTREDTRLAPLGTMTPAGELTTQPGVIPGGDPFAASGAGAMSLQIGVGRAAVQGTLAQGAYPVAVDAPEVVTFTDGSAQFARIDTVVLRVFDGLFDTSGQTLARVEVVEGDATATPTAPTLEPACLPLWDVRVPAGASAGAGGIDWGSALTDRRRYTVAVGGIAPQGAAADAGAYDGQYRDAGGFLERWNAAAGTWVIYRPPESPIGSTLYVRKSQDTPRSTANLSADPHLSVTLAANATYTFQGHIVATSGTTEDDLLLSGVAPSGTSGYWAAYGPRFDTTSTDASNIRMVATEWNAGSRSFGTLPTAMTIPLLGDVKTGANGGTLAVHWSRSTGTGTTTLKAGSWIMLRRVV